MKHLFFIGIFILGPSAIAKSYFVKFKENKSLRIASESKSFSDKVLSLRPVSTNIAPFAVVESTLNENQLKAELENNSLEVAYVESNDIDYRVDSYEPADDNYSTQWGLHGTYGIRSEKAWSVQRGNKEVVVAVVDTGIDYTHSDLKNNLWTNEAELHGEEGIDDDGNGYVDDIYGINSHANNGNPLDGHGQGTHCAGVIGAVHNTEGIAGIMANVKLMGIKIFSDSGRTTVEAIVKGIEYAVNNNVKIMSNSWGGSQKSQAIEEAIAEAGKAGVLFIAASGNGNMWGNGINTDKSPVYPASYDFDHVLSVGSITSNGSRSRFSNYGKLSVDIFAPGSNIMSTFKNQTYKSLSGTSMATPHVSGVAGLVLSEFSDADAMEIKRRIMDGARKLDSLSENSVSGGILDAVSALGM